MRRLSEYEKIRDIIEKEVYSLRNILASRPQMFSEGGKEYWRGNIEGLEWALKEIAEVHLSTQTAIEEEQQ